MNGQYWAGFFIFDKTAGCDTGKAVLFQHALLGGATLWR